MNGTDAILGMQWLQSVGTMRIDWKTRMMEFKHFGRRIRWYGTPEHDKPQNEPALALICKKNQSTETEELQQGALSNQSDANWDKNDKTLHLNTQQRALIWGRPKYPADFTQWTRPTPQGKKEHAKEQASNDLEDKVFLWGAGRDENPENLTKAQTDALGVPKKLTTAKAKSAPKTLAKDQESRTQGLKQVPRQPEAASQHPRDLDYLGACLRGLSKGPSRLIEGPKPLEQSKESSHRNFGLKKNHSSQAQDLRAHNGPSSLANFGAHDMYKSQSMEHRSDAQNLTVMDGASPRVIAPFHQPRGKYLGL